LFAQEIVLEIKSAITGIIGNIAILYRQNPEPERRKIKMIIRQKGVCYLMFMAGLN